LIVLGTSSSESVLPRMINKLEHLGCQESVVGLVIPTGYSCTWMDLHLSDDGGNFSGAGNEYRPSRCGQQLGIVAILL